MSYMDAIRTAAEYLQRGWKVIPIPHRSKKPVLAGWPRLRLIAETIGEYFNGAPQNIGVLLGEPIAWEDESAEPAEVDPGELREAVKRLADAVKIELGERPQLKVPVAKVEPEPDVLDWEQAEPATLTMQDRAVRCLAAMSRIGITDHLDGSRRLYTAACSCVEHDLDVARKQRDPGDLKASGSQVFFVVG